MKQIVFRRVLPAALMCALLMCALAVSAVAAEVGDFEDVDSGEWYYGAVDYCVRNGLIQGTTASTFSPEGDMTRAMFVTVLGRYAQPDTQYILTCSFDDVDRDEYYGVYVEWACQGGLTNGVEEDLFAPDVSISRQDAVTVFYRFAEPEVDYSDNALEGYPDAGQVADYAREAMLWAVQTGVIRGNNGYLNPRDHVSRAEMAQIFQNIAELGIHRPESHLFSLSPETVGDIEITDAKGVTARIEGAHGEPLESILADINAFAYGERQNVLRDDWSYRVTANLADGDELEIFVFSGEGIQVDGVFYTEPYRHFDFICSSWLPDMPPDLFADPEDIRRLDISDGTSEITLTGEDIELVCDLLADFTYSAVHSTAEEPEGDWTYRISVYETAFHLGDEDGDEDLYRTDLYISGDALISGYRAFDSAESGYLVNGLRPLFYSYVTK